MDKYRFLVAGLRPIVDLGAAWWLVSGRGENVGKRFWAEKKGKTSAPFFWESTCKRWSRLQAAELHKL